VGDEPHHFVSSSCWVCGQLFAFDPHTVPSVPLTAHGEPAQMQHDVVHRKPVCRECVERINPSREAAGLALWTYTDDTYRPVPGLPE
jgi:hypothetical protein